MFVKVCGITSKRDAHIAAGSGASAIGLVFCPSPRRVSPEQARTIRRGLPSWMEVVGVFLDEVASRVRYVADYCRLDAIQLHGNETPEMCRALGMPVIKAVRVRNRTSLDMIHIYRGNVRAILLDAWHPTQEGGRGRAFDWRLAAGARTEDVPLILAGGLTPENVGSAVAMVRPWGLDVSSGVERRPGVKEPFLVRRFLEQALPGNER
ncbi:MAG: phosphoribosylanthranilate isomerase [Thermodesulfobacteriota bacterium]